MRAGRARTGGVVLILLVLATCSLMVPAAAAPTAAPVQVVRHAAGTAGPNDSTTVPTSHTSHTSHPGKGVKLGSVVWAVLAVAVLGAAVATPLALRRHRERAAPTHRSDEG